MMKKMIVSALAIGGLSQTVAAQTVPAVHNGQPVQLRAEYVPVNDYVPEMADAAAAAALPPPAPDPRLAPTAADHQGALPPGWQPAPATGWNQSPAQAWSAPPSPPIVQHSNMVVPVPVPVPVAYGGWGGWGNGVTIAYGGGWNRGWNRGWYRGYRGGWGGWGRPAYGGWGRGWGRCRASGGGALVGGIAGATIGYGLGNPWDRSTGVIVGGLVGALAGSAIERSGRC